MSALAEVCNKKEELSEQESPYRQSTLEGVLGESIAWIPTNRNLT